jgi:uncharacterized protein (TIGR03118 family)
MLSWLRRSNWRSSAGKRRRIVPAVGLMLEELEERRLLAANPITVNGVGNFNLTAGQSAQGTVATFSDTNPALLPRDFTTTINWGDGTTSAGQVVQKAIGQFVVMGRHTFTNAATRQITVTVRDILGNVGTNGSFSQTNLVSDQEGVAPNTDPNLVNPWGMASSTTSPLWVSDNGTGVSTLYNGAGVPQSLVVTIPPVGGAETSAPTGVVFNGTNDFATSTGPSHFIFATEDGSIAAWSSGTEAETKVDNSASGAVYKGITTGAVGNNNFLYATNFHSGKVDVFDKNFNPVTATGIFQNPQIPAGFAPFGIQNLRGFIVVTYAKQDADKHDDVAGPGNGFVAAFTTSGRLVKTIAAHGPLNSPWGLAVAPSNFGQFSNALLVGNFGDGAINAFDPTTGKFLGPVTDTTGIPIDVDGLWTIRFGNGGSGGETNQLFFTAGPDDEQHGLLGNFVAVGQPTTVRVK